MLDPIAETASITWWTSRGRMRSETDGFLLIHSNAGIPAMKGGQIIYPESPGYMAERFRELADIGVNIIGGCCGTGPEHIRALAAAVGR